VENDILNTCAILLYKNRNTKKLPQVLFEKVEEFFKHFQLAKSSLAFLFLKRKKKTF
jgi:hypothetical protein